MTAAATRSNAKPAGGLSRLILQDPLAFDQASQPVLRSTVELNSEPSGGMDREKARELWESLSLEPEVAQERQSERKRLLARADSLAREATATKAQAIELQAQLAKAQDDRLNHPLVYAGAAGLLGLGALWLLERRKRLQLQERELQALAQPPQKFEPNESLAALQEQVSVFSLEDSPDLATDFATDLSGLPAYKPALRASADNADKPKKKVFENTLAGSTTAAPAVQTPTWAQSQKNTSQQLPTEDELVAMAWQEQDRSLLGLSKRVLGNMLRRRDQRQTVALSHSSGFSVKTDPLSTSTASTLLHSDSQDDSMQQLYDEEAQQAFESELLAQRLQMGEVASYNPDQANIDLLSQTRIMPEHGEDAMEHLLELRTAANGLCALGRPDGALRLLDEHVLADPATCAWAYLQSMQICQELERREEFESMRKRYRQQFNRMAPYWHEPNSNVLGLDGYARAAGELCTAWALGREQAQAVLVSWLIGPVLGRKLVQLPAYHDLFDLYEILEFIQGIEFSDQIQPASTVKTKASQQEDILGALSLEACAWQDVEEEFVPTVSLLDLDYEFSSDVTLEASEVNQSEKAVTVVKPGHFSVDFNVTGTQIGSLLSVPAELDKK